MFPWSKSAFLAISPMLLLSACGGGSGAGIAIAPPPAPTPSPTPGLVPLPGDTTAELLAPTATQELAVSSREQPVQIRYDASRDLYEIKTDGFDWSALVDNPDAGTTSPEPNHEFVIVGKQGNFNVRAHYRSLEPAAKYRFSNLATWSSRQGSQGSINYLAVGVPSPANAIPLTGSSQFKGIALGQADVPNSSWGGDLATTLVGGAVSLVFDFGRGALSGTLSLGDECDCENNFSLGTLTFSNTAFSNPGQTFSGSFATEVTGTNAFDGRFTGPGAEELIGSWTVPFLLEGVKHQAWGAWIAKRDN